MAAGRPVLGAGTVASSGVAARGSTAGPAGSVGTGLAARRDARWNWPVASSLGGVMTSRRSTRSNRCSTADSASEAAGSSSRAHATSSSSRGAVAPRISPSPACTTSA